MQSADAAQCEALRLAELRDKLAGYQKDIFALAHHEFVSFGHIEAATYIDQASIKLNAAIQAINVELRNL